jgi:hydroxyatrazine ethylaminohydrolase
MLINYESAIIPCDANERIFHGSDILVEGSKIVSIGKNIAGPADETLDASGKSIRRL